MEKPSSRGVSSLHHVVPIAPTSSMAHALALSAHMYVCLLLCVYSALRGCHTAALPGAGTNDSDRPLNLIAVTR